MVRKCGDCNLCCKLPNIHTPKNFKKDYTWCKHCEIGVGCKIYSDRPKMCKDFVCAWLLGLTPEEVNASLRLSIGKNTTIEEINKAADLIPKESSSAPEPAWGETVATAL